MPAVTSNVAIGGKQLLANTIRQLVSKKSSVFSRKALPMDTLDSNSYTTIDR